MGHLPEGNDGPWTSPCPRPAPRHGSTRLTRRPPFSAPDQDLLIATSVRAKLRRGAFFTVSAYYGAVRRGLLHIALMAATALALSGCGFADVRAPLPEFMRVKE